MRKPIVYLLVAASAASFTAPAFAAKRPKSTLPVSKPLLVKDAAGDANGLNTQGGLLPADPEQPGAPGNQAGSDIVSFSLSRLDDGTKITALVGTLTLSAAPEANRDFRIRMSADGCSTYFLEYEASATGSSASLRNNCAGGTTAKFDPIDAVVKGNSIVWTVPIKNLSGGLKLGSPLAVKGAQVSFDSGAAIFPGIDEVITDQTYKIGQ